MVLAIFFNNTFWGTVASCTVHGGVVSTSITQSATCVQGSDSKFYIKNIGGFEGTPNLASSTHNRIKISFVGGTVTNTANININFFMELYANIDAYT